MGETRELSGALRELAEMVDGVSPEVAARALPLVAERAASETFDKSELRALELFSALAYQRALGRQVAPLARREQAFLDLRRSLEAVEPRAGDWCVLRWFPGLGWLPLDGPRVVQEALDGLSWDLADECGLTGPGGDPSADDRARALCYPVPVAAVLKAIARSLDAAPPPVVERAFALGCEDLPWVAEGRHPGEPTRVA